jgi:hypothetical protein
MEHIVMSMTGVALNPGGNEIIIPWRRYDDKDEGFRPSAVRRFTKRANRLAANARNAKS